MSEHRRFEDDLTDEERDEAIQQYLFEKHATDEELDAEILELQSRLEGVEVPEPVAPSSVSEATGSTDQAAARRYENFGDVLKCEHIKANNRACGSPALRGKRFCYFHAQLRPAGKARKPVQLPALEDERAIQMAVTKICQAVVSETIEPKRATAVLYGLQVASNAVKRAAANSRS